MKNSFGSNPMTIRDLEPLYRIAHKTLLQLYHQKKHKEAVQFIAQFAASQKGQVRITYFKKDKSGKMVMIFFKDYPFKYKAVMNGPGKPQASSFNIKVNGKEIDLRTQKIYLDR